MAQWAARAWLAEDPDPVTVAELTQLLASCEAGDQASLRDLAERFTVVMPRDYARVVAAREEAEEAGLDEEATTAMMMEAAHG